MNWLHPIFGAILDDFARAPQFTEAAKGNCPPCGGTGEIGAQMNYRRCPACGGSGEKRNSAEAYIEAAQPARAK